MLGLYIHYPYCLQRCTYCDFATDIYKNEEKSAAYFQSLSKELLLSAHSFKNKELSSIYVGGGTPSLASPRLYEAFFDLLQRHGFTLSPTTEVSLEINPETVDRQKLQDFMSIGFNRFSLGVQTFNDELLKKVGRLHTSKDTLNNLNDLQSLGANFSCDLLYSLPKQNHAVVIADLNKIISFAPTHVSPYMLTLPKKHFLQRGRANDKEQIKMMADIGDLLVKNNYEQYEISNFALSGFKSRHNYNAWKGLPYWGLGMSAHSYLDEGDWGFRFANPNSVRAYENLLATKPTGPAYQDTSVFFERLKRHEALSDFCHTSLRLREGIIFKDLLTKFGPAITELVKSRIIATKTAIYLEKTSDGVRLNWDGILFSNQVFEDFLFLEEDISHLDII